MRKLWVVVSALIAGCFPGSWSFAPGSTATDAGTTTDVPETDVATGVDATMPSDVDNAAVLCAQGPSGCNFVSSSGCPGSQSCLLVLNAGSSLTSVCADGTSHAGEACDQTHGLFCTRGLQCLDNVCTTVCCGSHDETCIAAPGGTSRSRCASPIGHTPVKTCAESCDWNTQDCSNGNCVPVDLSGNAVCLRIGSGVISSSCSNAAQCGQGLTCVGVIGCRRLCTPSIGCIPATLRCMQLDGAPAGFGYCGT